MQQNAFVGERAEMGTLVRDLSLNCNSSRCFGTCNLLVLSWEMRLGRLLLVTCSDAQSVMHKYFISLVFSDYA